MSRKPSERFEDDWKTWARRPPRTTAPDAARQVLSRIWEPRRSPAYGWLAAAAAVLLGVGLWASLRPPPPVPEAPSGFGLTETQPLAEGVVLILLDADTPLYMTLTPPRATESSAEKGDPT